MLSCVLIIPAALKDTANALGEAMGWGPSNYSVPLTNATELSHYGLHAWVEPSFVAMIEAGEMPGGLAFPQADFDAVLGALIKSFRDDMTGHFAAVCADHGLAHFESQTSEKTEAY